MSFHGRACSANKLIGKFVSIHDAGRLLALLTVGGDLGSLITVIA